jgi:hypothetical protein
MTYIIFAIVLIISLLFAPYAIQAIMSILDEEI